MIIALAWRERRHWPLAIRRIRFGFVEPASQVPVDVASFDRPGERPDFYKGNCEMVAEMLAAKAGVSAWWCEPAEGRS
jgi:hypothetical protein